MLASRENLGKIIDLFLLLRIVSIGPHITPDGFKSSVSGWFEFNSYNIIDWFHKQNVPFKTQTKLQQYLQTSVASV